MASQSVKVVPIMGGGEEEGKSARLFPEIKNWQPTVTRRISVADPEVDERNLKKVKSDKAKKMLGGEIVKKKKMKKTKTLNKIAAMKERSVWGGAGKRSAARCGGWGVGECDAHFPRSPWAHSGQTQHTRHRKGRHR